MVLRAVINQGGGGASNLPNVNTFADLPSAASNSGVEYVVLTATGVWPVNRKSAGVYYSDGTIWAFKGAAPNDVGLPAGGTANQVLAKVDSADFNLQWVTPSGGSSSFNNGSTQKGHWSLHLPISGGFRAAGYGAQSSVTGTASNVTDAVMKKHGFVTPIATTSGASWRHAVQDGTKLFVYESANEYTGGTFVVQFVTPTSMANYRIQAGVGNSVTSDAADNDVANNTGFYFRASSNASDATWKYYARNLTVPTVLDTGVPVVADCTMEATITFNRVLNSFTMRLKNLTTGADSNDLPITLDVTNMPSGGFGFVAGKDLTSAARTFWVGKHGSNCFGV